MRRKRWMSAVAVALVVAAVTGGTLALSRGDGAASATQQTRVTTSRVERGRLSDKVTLEGILTYQARPDGTPYPVVDQARGTYTDLPEAGDKVDCGDVLFRVDDAPVLLLCGTVPAYRDLHAGDAGPDVRQLNRELHRLGYDHAAGVDPDGSVFTSQTTKALERLQHANGSEVTGELHVDDAVFLPRPVRIARVTGVLGGTARPGEQVAQATSDTLEVQVSLDASRQGEVKVRQHAQITLPGNTSVQGRVARLGRVARTAGKDDTGDATIPAYLTLDDPRRVRGLDRAPVQADITTRGVRNVLSVPVVAVVGRSGGGYAVEVVRSGGRRALVAVRLGLFDTTAGRVQVVGGLREGDHVVVPSP